MSSGANKFDAARVAMLARLELAPESLARFQSEMEKIVSYVDQLTELDVDGIEPTAHAAPMTNVLREDQSAIVLNSNSQQMCGCSSVVEH